MRRLEFLLKAQFAQFSWLIFCFVFLPPNPNHNPNSFPELTNLWVLCLLNSTWIAKEACGWAGTVISLLLMRLLPSFFDTFRATCYLQYYQQSFFSIQNVNIYRGLITLYSPFRANFLLLFNFFPHSLWI